jgi:hypothetical protein
MTSPEDFPSDESDAPADEVEPEVPEADAIEQRQPTVPDAVDDVPGAIPVEVPEADALEQARGLEVDDEPDPRDEV